MEVCPCCARSTWGRPPWPWGWRLSAESRPLEGATARSSRRSAPPRLSLPLAVVTLLLAAGWHAVRNPPGLLAPYLWPELTPGRSWREALAVWVVPLAAATVLAALTLAATLARRRPEATAGAVAVLAIAD